MTVSQQAALEMLAAVRSVLLVDWPSRDVPDTLARAGLRVFVRGGPGPDRYSECQAAGADIVVRPVGRPPDEADLVYSYRPPAELPDIVALARTVGARAVWTHPAVPVSPEEEDQARGIVESAGLRHLSGPDIVEAVLAVRGPAQGVHEPGTAS